MLGLADPTVYEVNQQDYPAGSNFITLDTIPLDILLRAGYNWYIEPWTGNCERLFVGKVYEGHLDLLTPTNLFHPHDSTVIALSQSDVNPHLYNAIQSWLPAYPWQGSPPQADDWRPLQRCAMEHRYQFVRWGGGTVTQPLIVEDGFYILQGDIGMTYEAGPAQFNPACIQTGIPNDYYNGAASVVKSAGGKSKFTAYTDDTIVLQDSPDPDLKVDFPVILDNPYEIFTPSGIYGSWSNTMPGGIVSGRHYLVKEWNPNTKTLKVYEIGDATKTAVNITSQGVGVIWFNFLEEVDYKIEEFIPGGGSIGLDSIHLWGKPGSYSKDIRTTGSSWSLGGTATRHNNLDIQDGNFDRRAAMYLLGDDHYVDYLNQNALGIGCIPVGRGIRIKLHHFENLMPCGVDIKPGCYDFRVEQMTRFRASDVTNAYLRDLTADGEASWEIGPCWTGNSNSQQIYVEGAENDEFRTSQEGWQGGAVQFSDSHYMSPSIGRDDTGKLYIPDDYKRSATLSVEYAGPGGAVKIGLNITYVELEGTDRNLTGKLQLPNAKKFAEHTIFVFKNQWQGDTPIIDHEGTEVAVMTDRSLMKFEWADLVPYTSANWVVTNLGTLPHLG